MSDLPWQSASVLLLGVFLVGGGVIAFIAGRVEQKKQRRRQLRRSGWAVGNDAACYRDVKGIHR
jgi:hypothetical protein